MGVFYSWCIKLELNPRTGLDFAYDFDNIGNRISFTENSDLTEYVANELNQYSQIDDGSTLEPTHDADGNLTFDGQFNYSWNGENRLVQVTSAVVTEGAKRLTFWYDHQGRRFQKRVEEYQSGAWNETELTRFLYDNWNLIAEYDATSRSNTRDKTYTWGLDLSQTLQGAGGVGGLLSMTEESSSDTYYYAFDANGNVTQLIDESGNLSAHYEYSPFGQLVASTGPMATTNPYRFSTKYQDQATGLLYYGFRYYDAETGRWLSRDPIKERGGFNVYGFVGNDTFNKWDLLGMKSISLKPSQQKTITIEFVMERSDGDVGNVADVEIKAEIKADKECNVSFVQAKVEGDVRFTLESGGLGLISASHDFTLQEDNIENASVDCPEGHEGSALKAGFVVRWQTSINIQVAIGVTIGDPIASIPTPGIPVVETTPIPLEWSCCFCPKES